MRSMRWFLLFLLLPAVLACSSEIYVRDGVTDGDTFYLAPTAWTDDDPVLQSWVAYSLMKSACQLEIGGDPPSRASSYGCEFTARMALLDTWDEQKAEEPAITDSYLDTLARVRRAGFLDEYTVHYHGKKRWLVPAEVDLATFAAWRKQNLRRHRSRTRLIGSWGYAVPSDTLR
jgi:hypothetical protein